MTGTIREEEECEDGRRKEGKTEEGKEKGKMNTYKMKVTVFVTSIQTFLKEPAK
jgi:hypothetical protein